MKKKLIRVGLVLAVCSSLGLSSCIGSFALTNKLLSWNQTISNKVVNEIVFVAFWILPVYEVSGIADLLVINSIEFWSGDNPMACGTKRIEGNDGMNYLVKCDGKGYDIVCENDGTSVRLDFEADSQRWDVTVGDQTYELLTFVDPEHVRVPALDGSYTTIELSRDGLMAYRAAGKCKLECGEFAMN